MVFLIVGLALGFGIGYLVGQRRELLTVVKRQRSTKKELGTLKRDELYERAQADEIPGRSGMNKQELHDALDDNQDAASELVDHLTGRNVSDTTAR